MNAKPTIELLEEMTPSELNWFLYQNLYKPDLSTGLDPTVIIPAIYLGANIEIYDPLRRTAIFQAIRHKNIDILKSILNAKANIEAVEKYGRTPLYYAICNLNTFVKLNKNKDWFPRPDMPYMNIIKLLLEFGANPNAKAYGHTIYELAFHRDNKWAADILINAGAEPSNDPQTKILRQPWELVYGFR